ncbi:MAG: hypothetical protein GF401_17780 [Chitinivibrionales bacterium]|nr:hypothetical protein [Chitinivibrionales bacterium]
MIPLKQNVFPLFVLSILPLVADCTPPPEPQQSSSPKKLIVDVVVEDQPDSSKRERKLNSLIIRVRNLRSHSHEKNISSLETMEADRIIDEVEEQMNGQPTELLLSRLELAAVLYELGTTKYRCAEREDENIELVKELKKLKKTISELETMK